MTCLKQCLISWKKPQYEWMDEYGGEKRNIFTSRWYIYYLEKPKEKDEKPIDNKNDCKNAGYKNKTQTTSLDTKNDHLEKEVFKRKRLTKKNITL